MVTTNMGLPDPDNPNEDLTVTNETIMSVVEDDSDQELENQTDYTQYQPLPTCPNGESDNFSDGDEESDAEDLNATENSEPPVPVPAITRMETILVKEVWSDPVPEVCDIKMDSERVNEVKKAMLNITLPDSAIPAWATNIPEDEWKLQLIKRLQK